MGIGIVGEAWRYPVKSMMGERLDTLWIGPNGVVGDRGWAARDEVKGGIRGAKKIGGLMRLAARYSVEPTEANPTPDVEITLPDGGTVSTSAPDVDAAVSKAVGHEVTLHALRPASDLDHYRRGAPDSDDFTTELRSIFGRTDDEPLPDLASFPPDLLGQLMEYESPPGTYFDAFPLLVVTDVTLASLGKLAPHSAFDVRRFRPNIVVSLNDASAGAGGFPEQAWPGGRLRIGEIELAITAPCPRCVMVTRGFADLPEDRAVLRTIVREAEQNVGVYATVLNGGTVSVGDTVEFDGS